MTDRQGALGVLVSLDAPEREQALAAFFDRFKDDALVLDKWFALQAAAQRTDTLDAVEKLASHPSFTLQNPNRLRALAGSLGMNHWVFNHASGRGYRFLADMIIAADRLNPQVAARLVPPLGRWRRLEPNRSALMREQLKRIVDTHGAVAGRLRAGEQKPVVGRQARAPAGLRSNRRLRRRLRWRRD